MLEQVTQLTFLHAVNTMFSNILCVFDYPPLIEFEITCASIKSRLLT